MSSKDEEYVRPRSPLAQAAWDYQEEAKARLAEDGGITTETAFEILANHRIRGAIKSGEFDNLKGKGKPLAARAHGSAPTDPAAKVLKNAGFKPEWIELGVEIRAGTQQVRDRLSAPGDRIDPQRKQEALVEAEMAAEVERLNALIAKHNRMAPVASVQMGLLSLERLLDAAAKE